MTDHKPKRKGKPRSEKPEAKPLPPNHTLEHGIGPIQKRLIGDFIVEWSYFEAALDDLIWRILRLAEDDGKILTKRSQAETKIAILRAIAPRHLKAELLDKLRDALDDADAVREDRNFVAHGVWGTLNGEAIALSSKAKALPGEVVAETFTHERLRRLIGNTKKIRDMIVDVILEHDPSPEK